VAIRALIEFFPVAGPAMNPMLATAWDVFGVGRSGEFPTDHGHYFVYWVCPCLAAILASISYVIVSGGTVFGYKLPIQLKGKTVKKD
jgi:glycerol uptake facilitator-like aquaporin